MPLFIPTAMQRMEQQRERHGEKYLIVDGRNRVIGIGF